MFNLIVSTANVRTQKLLLTYLKLQSHITPSQKVLLFLARCDYIYLQVWYCWFGTSKGSTNFFLAPALAFDCTAKCIFQRPLIDASLHLNCTSCFGSFCFFTFAASLALPPSRRCMARSISIIWRSRRVITNTLFLVSFKIRIALNWQCIFGRLDHLM